MSDAGTPPPPATPTGRPVAGYGASLVLALLGGWFTVGLMLDAWAHNNIPELETFFTPWHAAFYSGFTATAAWVLWLCRRAFRDEGRQLDAVPVGYGPTLIALVGFAAAGVGDLIWHTALGIEQSVDILFSPTHVGLIVTMFVIVSTPVRSAWVDRTSPVDAGLRRLLPAVLATAFAVTLLLLFMQYANALTYSPSGLAFALSGHQGGGETSEFAAMAAVTTALLITPLLILARRWRLPAGSATIIYLALGGLSYAVTGFRNLPLVVGLLIGGVVVDILAAVLRPAPDDLVRSRVFGALATLAVWVGIICAAYVVAPPMDIKLELLLGVPLVQSMLGLLLAVLLAPTRTPAPAEG